MSFIRQLMAPITLRFFDTDGLIETLQFLEMCDRNKLGSSTAKFADRTQFLIAKELLRRKVKVWDIF